MVPIAMDVEGVPVERVDGKARPFQRLERIVHKLCFVEVGKPPHALPSSRSRSFSCDHSHVSPKLIRSYTASNPRVMLLSTNHI